MVANNKLKEDYNICIGVITSVNGVKGLVKIRSFTEQPEDIASFGKLFDDQQREYQLSIATLKRDHVIAGIKGVNSRNEAEKLRNVKLYIKRSNLPSSTSNEFYLADLIGMNATFKDGTKFGTVKNLLNFGAGDIIEICDLNTEKMIYYPFTKQFVLEVNTKKNQLVLEPLEELIAAAE